jgi:glycosyltransferase involved in cell wall biosynthesis
MKILVSILKYPPDFTGAGLRIKHMYHNMLDRGAVDQVYVITSREHAAPKNRTELDQQEIRYVGFNPYAEPQTTRLSKLKKANFVLKAGIRTIIQYFKLFRNIDIVHTIDSSWLSTVVGWCAFFTGKPLIKEIVLLGADDPLSIMRHKQFALQHIFLLPFKYAKLVVVISAKLQKACLAYGLAEEKIWCRHNPIYVVQTEESASYQQSLPGVDFSRPLILNVGRINPRKNTRFLLEAAFYLDGNAQLLFVGPSDDIEYERKVKQLAAELESATNGRIITAFLGRITNRRILFYLYKTVKLFWFASKFEGLGNVVPESLLCGTPVVTLAVGGIMQELVTNDQDGEVIDSEDPEKFAAIVSKWLNKKDIDHAGIAQRACERFDPAIIEEGYLSRFKQLLR